MIEAYSLYSGSSGNAYLIKCKSTALLVDAGRSCAALCRSIKGTQTAPEDISAVLVTHEHSDHVSALRVFCKKYSPLLISVPPVLQAICENEGMCDRARAMPLGREFVIGDIAVSACGTSHDSAASVCYRFRTAEGESLVIATDMGEVTPACSEFLTGADFAVIESNHDPRMLRVGPYPAWLKSRIASRVGHLSNEQCGELAVLLAKAGTKGFVLAHLSQENNTPELAYGAVSECLGAAGFGDLPVTCAGESRTVKITVDGGCCAVFSEADV